MSAPSRCGARGPNCSGEGGTQQLRCALDCVLGIKDSKLSSTVFNSYIEVKAGCPSVFAHSCDTITISLHHLLSFSEVASESISAAALQDVIDLGQQYLCERVCWGGANE